MVTEKCKKQKKQKKPALFYKNLPLQVPLGTRNDR